MSCSSDVSENSDRSSISRSQYALYATVIIYTMKATLQTPFRVHYHVCADLYSERPIFRPLEHGCELNDPCGGLPVSVSCVWIYGLFHLLDGYPHSPYYCNGHRIHTVCTLIFVGCIFRGLWLLMILHFIISGRSCFAIAQEPDLNFCRCKLLQMTSDPRISQIYKTTRKL